MMNVCAEQATPASAGIPTRYRCCSSSIQHSLRRRTVKFPMETSRLTSIRTRAAALSKRSGFDATTNGFRFLLCQVYVCCLMLHLVGLAGAQQTLDEGLLTPHFRSGFGLYPSVVNLASQAKITANATCGQQGPAKYCKLVEHVERYTLRNQQCMMCDASNPSQRHPIEYAIDGFGGRWWQSPTIDQGYQNHYVTITLDLEQVFQVAYVIIKAANAPRPGNWILEKSTDGNEWFPWQYFATSDGECSRVYGVRAAGRGPPRYATDQEVICTSYFSDIIPLQNGEIHVSLINGRPTAENPSKALMQFTSARYIRLRLQKIRTLHGDLMALSGYPASYQDPSVTRRYYYSIKDISIGGMCICYGHASTCPTDPSTGMFRCACEHNTAGPNCEQCLPGFQQYKWNPGNYGFQCEACNCHGHSDDCFYDEGVAARKESLNLLGEYLGGGVCVSCRDNTEGINCQTCVDGYYRPFEAEADDASPCIPCDCDPYGGRRVPARSGPYVCVKDITFIDSENDLYPGSCYCNEGFTGSRCDRCAFGFRGFPRCDPCPCKVAGSLNADPCVGECVCKENVEGVGCSQCKDGFFNMQRQNPAGCERCYCSGVAMQCASVAFRWSTIHTNHNWEVRDRRNRRRVTPQFDYNLNEPYVEHGETARNLGTAMYYWAAPVQYLGERLSSYGGTIRYTVSYDILRGSQPLPIQDADVLIEGNGKSLTYNYMGSLIYPQEETEVTLKLEANIDGEPSGWVDSNSLLPASKEEMMTVLKHVTRIYIRAVYSRNTGAVYRIRDVYMQTATESGEGAVAHSVERCLCPPGYLGFSCETCASGYWRSGNLCLPCECNGHSGICNQLNGACENCQHNTMGMHCERCKPGFFGDSTVGTATDCQSCSCPLPIPSNNFSPLCYLDRTTTEMVCLQCPIGYAGRRCESCEQGYFGDPTTPGGSCEPCACNGNSQSCDTLTGVCTYCRGHTAGDHCEICKPAYYGDAIDRKNCGPCACDPIGSLNRQCHFVTGQCSCRPGVYGRKCDACESNHYLSAEARMCVACECDNLGSLTGQCGADGSCPCRDGVEGRQCDSCVRGYFGFSELGCIECNCEHTNGNCNADTGECICPPNTKGEGCGQCIENSFGMDLVNGCEVCNCSNVGSVAPNCHNTTGQCSCRPEFDGLRCDSCRRGFYGYPDCRPCSCNLPGAMDLACAEDGQCHCKKNVVGVHCDQCADGYYGLSESNLLGCSECFCFGAADSCVTAQGYVWGPPIALNSAPAEVINPSRMGNRIQGLVVDRNDELQEDKVVIRDLHRQPYYWRLPSQFNGDKLMSYGGKLRYTIYYVAVLSSSDVEVENPSVVLRGGTGNMITIQHQLENPQTGQSRDYVVLMHEAGWTHLDSSRNVTRAEFATVLSNVEFFLIKATYGHPMGQSRLSNVLLDYAEPGYSGRGDAGSPYPTAQSIEQCFCYQGYTGLSCQDCATGYMRIQQGSNYGMCEACDCNNRSNTCDIGTGVCLNCRDKFVGNNCERCAPGYYLAGRECRKCACPEYDAGQNFSPTCHSDGSDGIVDYTCDACKLGYEGKHCDSCSDGYFGDPTSPGGICAECGCNVAGSLDGVCDKVTGQCRCDEGITGRICDQCMPHHVITQGGCKECNDGCSGKLLTDVEGLTNMVVRVEVHNMFPPPWNRLIAARNLTTQLWKRLDNETTDMLDRLAFIVSVPTDISKLRQNVSSLKPRANECKNSGEITAYDVKDTETRLKEQRRMSRYLSNVAEGFSLTLSRFVDQLRNGTNEEVLGMQDKLTGWVNTMRQINFEPLRAVAVEELEISANFLDGSATNFTAVYSSTFNTIFEQYDELQSNLTAKNESLTEFGYMMSNITSSNSVTNTMNDLNRQTLRQVKSKIEHISNIATIVGVNLSQSEALVRDAGILLLNGTNTMTELFELKLNQEAESLALRLVSDEMMNAVQANAGSHQAAIQHVKLLESDAEYIRSVQQNITAFSFNETEAATRWTQIADNFEYTENQAEEALAKAMEALNSKTADMARRSDASLQRSRDINDEVTEMENNLKGDRRLLQNQKEILRYENLSLRNLAEQHERNQTRLKDIRRNAKLNTKRVDNIVNRVGKTLNGMMRGFLEAKTRLQRLRQTKMFVSQRSRVMNEIANNQDWLANVSGVVDRSMQASKDATFFARRFKLRSDNTRSNISYIQKLIEDTKAKAASIRQASVKSTGECAMRYKPNVLPSTTTEIILNVETVQPNNTLLYLSREMQDFMVVQMVNGRVSVAWDLGGGPGFVEHPLVVRSTQLPDVKDWFRIEVFRRNQETTLSVYRVTNTTKTSVSASSPGTFSGLDVGSQDLLFVGGIPNTTKNIHSSVKARTFTGCMGEAFLQGKSVGLWNFQEIHNKIDCTGCVPSPIIKPERQQTNTYSFTGMSYSVLPLPNTLGQHQQRISVRFRTFSSEGLIIYAASSTLPDFMSLELNDGHIFLKIDLGTGVHSVSTSKRYNDHQWVKVTVQRIGEQALLTANRAGDLENVNMAVTNTDGLLNLTSDDFICVGGVPPERTLKKGVTTVSFVGCLREFLLDENLISLKRSVSGSAAVRESRVESTCPSEVTRDISIGKGGYAKMKPLAWPREGAITMTFNTLEPNAILMVGTSAKLGAKRRRRQTTDAFYSLYLLNGRVCLSMQTKRQRTFNLSSMYSFYDNGQTQMVTLRRNGTKIQLQINDNSDQTFGVLPDGSVANIAVRHLFIGGIPRHLDLSPMIPTKRSINGCVRSIMANTNVNFLDAIEAKNALFGTCSNLPEVPIPSASSSGIATTDAVTVISTPTVIADEFPEMFRRMPPPKDPLCGAVSNISTYSDGTAVHFGLTTHSRAEFFLTKNIKKKFLFDLRVRTFARDGLLLHANSPGSVDHFSLLVKDGAPIFRFDNGGGVGEGLSKKKIDDGKWHRIRIKRTRRKGLLSVDGKKTKFKSLNTASILNVNSTLFVGGLPEGYKHKRLGKLTNSMDACIRDLKLNKKTTLNFTTARRVAVEPCSTAVENGTYFHGKGFAILDTSYRVGSVMDISFSFRTKSSNAVFLSVQGKRDGLALEMVNGTIYFRANNGEGPLEAMYASPTKGNRKTFSLCNGKWHTIWAQKNRNTLRLTVDGQNGHNTTNFTSSFFITDTSDNLYIGGLPDDEKHPKLMQTDQKFFGCIKDMSLSKLGAVRFDEAPVRKHVYPNSCPKKKSKKKKTRRSRKARKRSRNR